MNDSATDADLREPNEDAERRPRYVFHRRPRCPVCGGSRLLAYRTSRHGDETITRHTRCADCGQRVYLVLE